MKRKAVYLQSNSKNKIKLYIDKLNVDAILNYIQQDRRHEKKFDYIKGIILENLRIPDVFDKEDISEKAKDVYAMKFFKGQENDRIYCKKISHKGCNCMIIVASELHLRKKTQKNSKKEISIIEKVGSYEYEFEE